MLRIKMNEECRVVAILRDEVYECIELVDAFMAKITDNKETSGLIEILNQQYPMNDLGHLKRVKCADGQLYILIALKDGSTATENVEMARDIKALSNFSVVQVPKRRPITRAQYEAAKTYWPTQFHEDKRLEKILKGKFFSSVEVEVIVRFLKMAMSEVHEEGQTGAVIVDPDRSEVVARACSSSSHPLHHAVMRCIDTVATAQGGGAWWPHGFHSYASQNEATRSIEGAENIPEDCPVPTKKRKVEKQYLCTGFDVYVTMEPCVMCAMALLHSRVRRVFYNQQNIRTGGLESCYKIHLHQKLNHHFEVFRITNSVENLLP